MENSILILLFEYDAQIALEDGCMGSATFTVSFPHSAVMALRQTRSTPDTMRIRVVTPGGETGYDIPVIKVQNYSLDEIFRRELLFFLPFYIFSHEKDLPECEKDEAKLNRLTDEYRHIRERLDGKKVRPGHIFITESGEIEPEVVEEIIALVHELIEVKEVHHTLAGSTVSSHCGPKTLGVLFINE